MSPPLTHDQCRSKICSICGQKGSKKSMVTIVNGDKNHIRIKHLYPDFSFDPDDQFQANGLCSRDRNLLRDIVNEKADREKLPAALVRYSDTDFGGKCGTDLKDLTDCECPFCSKAKTNVGTPGPREKAPFPKGRPPSPSKAQKFVLTCSSCKVEVIEGKPHKCNVTKARKNLSKLLDEDPVFKEMKAAETIREKAAEASSSSDIQLHTGGGKFMSIPNPKPSTSKALYPGDTPVPAEAARQIFTAAGVSNNVGNLIAQGFRELKGRKFFEADLSGQLSALDRCLDDFYTSKDIFIDSSNKDEVLNEAGKVLRTLFYCPDVPGLFKHIMKQRGYPCNAEIFVKVGIDKGGRWLKVCANIERKWGPCSSPRYKRRRANFKDGPLANRFKESGVKKLIPLAFIQDTTESYDNLCQIVQLLDLNSLEYCPAFDMKCGLTFLGLGTAASSYPCPYCNMHKDDFADKKLFCEGGELRDFASISKNATAYQEAAKAHKGAKKLSAKEFESAEHSSLFASDEVDPQSLVVESIPPFPLHLLLGLGNQLYKEIEGKLILLGLESLLELWLKPLGLKQSARHSGQFNGNQMVAVLQNTHRLRKLLKRQHSKVIGPLLDAMDELESVRVACFSTNFLDDNFKKKIHSLARLWLKIGLSVTPKAHVLFVHVAQFLDFQNQASEGPKRGLGYWSEQSSESVHHDFEKHWVNGAYKREIGHEEYVAKTLKCIATYAAKHV